VPHLIVRRSPHFFWNKPLPAGILLPEASSIAEQTRRGHPMADRTALSVLGFALSGVAATVIVIAFLVVQHHIEAHAAFDTGNPVTASVIR